MREIEIKARVGDRNVLLDALKQQNITLSEPVTQRDQVFGLADVDGGDHNSAPWLRVRTETKNDAITHYFTLKKSVTNQMDSIEHETVVQDGNEMLAMMPHLGFAPYSDLTKTRAKAKLGEIEICVDHIDELGDFIEAEKLTAEDANYDEVAEELWVLLESFGVTRTDHVTDGYDVMMRKAKGLNG